MNGLTSNCCVSRAGGSAVAGALTTTAAPSNALRSDFVPPGGGPSGIPVLAELLKLASWSGERLEFFLPRSYDNEMAIVIERVRRTPLLAYLQNPTTSTMAIPTGQTYRSANNSSRREGTDRPLSSPSGIRFPIRQPMNTLTRSADIGMSKLAARKSTRAKKFDSARWGIDLSGCQSVQRPTESTEP